MPASAQKLENDRPIHRKYRCLHGEDTGRTGRKILISLQNIFSRPRPAMMDRGQGTGPHDPALWAARRSPSQFATFMSLPCGRGDIAFCPDLKS